MISYYSQDYSVRVRIKEENYSTQLKKKNKCILTLMFFVFICIYFDAYNSNHIHGTCWWAYETTLSVCLSRAIFYFRKNTNALIIMFLHVYSLCFIYFLFTCTNVLNTDIFFSFFHSVSLYCTIR